MITLVTGASRAECGTSTNRSGLSFVFSRFKVSRLKYCHEKSRTVVAKIMWQIFLRGECQGMSLYNTTWCCIIYYSEPNVDIVELVKKR